jgi:hypothetical protein
VKTALYRYETNDETGTVDALTPAPGLFVYRLPAHLTHPDFPWLLGHGQSGKSIAAFPDRQQALEGAELIADVADWTHTAEELRAEVDVYLLAETIEEFTDGVFLKAKRDEPTAQAA